MKTNIIKTGFIIAAIFAGTFSAGEAKAETSLTQTGKVCKVTRRGGTTIYVSSLDKDFPIRRGGTMIVVDPQPRQGIIVVKAMINRKMTQGEIKIDDTNCVPILPK